MCPSSRSTNNSSDVVFTACSDRSYPSPTLIQAPRFAEWSHLDQRTPKRQRPRNPLILGAFSQTVLHVHYIRETPKRQHSRSSRHSRPTHMSSTRTRYVRAKEAMMASCGDRMLTSVFSDTVAYSRCSVCCCGRQARPRIFLQRDASAAQLGPFCFCGLVAWFQRSVVVFHTSSVRLPSVMNGYRWSIVPRGSSEATSPPTGETMMSRPAPYSR